MTKKFSKTEFGLLQNRNSDFMFKRKVSAEIKSEMIKLYRKGFYLKGVADSQGSVIFFGKTARFIQLSSKNYRGLEEIGSLLSSLGIDNWCIYKNACGLRIFGRKNFINFSKKVNFIIARKKTLLNKMLRNYEIWKPTQNEMKRIVPKIFELEKFGIETPIVAEKLGIGLSTVYSHLRRGEQK